MKLITRDTDYAVRALSVLAEEKGTVVSVNYLVKKTEIPRPFLRKILQTLNRNGVLESKKGSGGGFILNKRIDDISVGDLVEIFQGEIDENHCLFKKRICPKIKTCNLRTVVTNIQSYVSGQLKAVTLKNIIDGEYTYEGQTEDCRDKRRAM